MNLSGKSGRLWFLLAAVTGALSAQAALIDVWRAADLDTLADGDLISRWKSAGNRTLTAAAGLQPTFKQDATPAGSPAVRFTQDWLKMASGSPAGGLTNFSLALVFKADASGGDYDSQWYGKSGLIDAEQGGVTEDWGLVIDEHGQLGMGMGNPDLSVYLSDSPSLADAKYHAAVFTWGNGAQGIWLDNQWSVSGPASTLDRNDVGLSFGGTHTGANGAGQRFAGDLVEVRFYDAKLSDPEVAAVIKELSDTHLSPNQPVIRSFAASTNQIYLDSPVTLSWSTTNATSLWIEPNVGAVTGPIGSSQVFPRSNTVYTLTSSNAFGVRNAQVSVRVDQGVPTANSLSVTAFMNSPEAIKLTGSDPQGGPLTFTVLGPPAHGSLTQTQALVVYTSTAGFMGNDAFTFKVNDGEFDSAPATVSIQVIAPPTAPSSIALSTTNLSPGAGAGTFIAYLRAPDLNPEDTHTFQLVSNYADNAQFAIVSNQLFASASFVGGPGKSYTVRLRATDSSGLWIEQSFTLTVSTQSQSVVINEVHYNPPDNTVREEFIELHNPSASSVDLSLWQLKGGVKYTIPAGTFIPAGGYWVIAQDPATLLAKYGVAALGPCDGSLSSEDDTVTLVNADGKQVNQVSYHSEFPWPVSANGEGGSMALVNATLDNTLGSSWRTENPPSPGKANQCFAFNAAPNLRQVHHTPEAPTSTNPVVITAKVTDPEGVASVQLQYQVVAPGNYVPAVLPVAVNKLIATPNLTPTPNPDYTNAANWLTVPMSDTGVEGDTLAGDTIYTAVLPAQLNRTLVRYRIMVTDTLGAARQAPFEDDPALNFAYYVYDGIPDYQGVSAQALKSLPVYTLISRAQDITQCAAYSGADQIPQENSGGLAQLARFAFNWPGTLVYDGKVYDNIRYRLHGANGRYQPGKRNWRFKFNRGNFLQAKDRYGDAYPRKWSHLTTGKGSNNRLAVTFSLNETLNYFLFNKVGVPAPDTFHFHFRVVTGVTEAPGPYTGDFWGLNWAQEDYDGRFLSHQGLEKGNLYKLINATFSWDLAKDMVGQQRYQGPFAVTNGMDGAAIQNGLLNAQTSEWIRARVNCAEWYRYHALCEAVRNYDFWPEANKNAAWYFEPPYSAANNNYGRLWVMPWDTDCTWGSTWNSGRDLVYNGIFLAASHPDLKIEYGNTLREVRDLLFQPDQINPLIDAFASQLRDFVPADLRRWNLAPAASGNYASLANQAGFTSPAVSGGLAAQAQDLKDFMFVGGNHAWWVDQTYVAAGGWITRLDRLAADAAIPTKPVIKYAGPTNYPVTGLIFTSSAFAAPQGASTFAALQWRVAEITPTNNPATNPMALKFEWDAVWDSGELPVFTNKTQVPAQLITPGKVYRARVRHQDTTGRWSNWSAPVEFTPVAMDTVSDMQKHLVLSEIMYNPPALNGLKGDEFEFLELYNSGANNLDLSGLAFTSGIDFTFTNGTQLAPGQYFLLGRNETALHSKYPGIIVNGRYTGKLDNSGETITLTHPYGDVIFSVTYAPAAPWPAAANGLGFSLVLAPGVATGYRASSQAGGTPGAANPAATVPQILLSEIRARSASPEDDAIELTNPLATAVNIGGWLLTDDPKNPWKYRIPDGTILAGGGYRVIDESQFNSTNSATESFGLSSLGESVYLFSADAAGHLTGYSHGFDFAGSEVGRTYGHYVNSAGEEQFPLQLAPSLGTNNWGPAVGPVVISEIHYVSNSIAPEFIELRNLTSATARLFDAEHPTNTWQIEGLGFTFPPGVELPAGGFVLLTAADPDTFRAQSGVPAPTPIFQYFKKLDNHGETITLLAPASADASGTPYCAVDRVDYRASAPWPVIMNPLDASLQRIDPGAYGNDPGNWRAAAPTPGTASASAAPVIHLHVATDSTNNQTSLYFEAAPNRAYFWQYENQADGAHWQPLATVPIRPFNRVEYYRAATQNDRRFFRVATPGLP
jgi:hypothetical protein